MRKNLRTLLAENDRLFGCFVQIPSPEIVEMARHFDYVIIDGEHGHISHEQMLSMVRAAEAVDLAVMVRISDIDPVLINRILDMGITSLLVPNVSSRKDAITLVKAAFYPPLGSRGACPFTRANYYGSSAPADYYKKTNEDLFISPPSKTRKALQKWKTSSAWTASMVSAQDSLTCPSPWALPARSTTLKYAKPQQRQKLSPKNMVRYIQR